MELTAVYLGLSNASRSDLVCPNAARVVAEGFSNCSFELALIDVPHAKSFPAVFLIFNPTCKAISEFIVYKQNADRQVHSTVEFVHYLRCSIRADVPIGLLRMELEGELDRARSADLVQRIEAAIAA